MSEVDAQKDTLRLPVGDFINCPGDFLQTSETQLAGIFLFQAKISFIFQIYLILFIAKDTWELENKVKSVKTSSDFSFYFWVFECLLVQDVHETETFMSYFV